MYEDRTRENLKREMLEELDESSGLNTLEGGYADQTFGPMAVKLEEFYGALRAMAMFAMVDETCGGMIDIAAGNYSVTRKPGVAATAMVHFVGSGGAHIPAETIFSTASGLCYIGVDPGGWYWQMYSGGDGSWYSGSRVPAPEAGEQTTLQLEWEGTTLLSATVNGAVIFENLDFSTANNERADRVGLKLSTWGGVATQVEVVRCNYTNQEGEA